MNLKMEANIRSTFLKYGQYVDYVKKPVMCGCMVVCLMGCIALTKGKVIPDCGQVTCMSIQLKVTFGVFDL